MRELQRSPNRKLLGVAAGCAEYFGHDIALWRALWALLGFLVPPLVLVYLILGAMLPGRDAATPVRQPGRRLIKSRDRWLAGVAGGVAEFLELDPLLVRLLFVASLFAGGTGVLIYLVFMAVMPAPDYSYSAYQMP